MKLEQGVPTPIGKVLTGENAEDITTHFIILSEDSVEAEVRSCTLVTHGSPH